MQTHSKKQEVLQMNVMGNMYAGTAKAFSSMKTANRNFKQDGKAADSAKTISEMTKEIGNLTVVMLDGNRSVGPDIKERYEAIVEARKLIAEAEAEKVHTKVVCPRCGKKTTAGMHYCGWCGSLINAAAE